MMVSAADGPHAIESRSYACSELAANQEVQRRMHESGVEVECVMVTQAVRAAVWLALHCMA
jgi:hypothetical protein